MAPGHRNKAACAARRSLYRLEQLRGAGAQAATSHGTWGLQRFPPPPRHHHVLPAACARSLRRCSVPTMATACSITALAPRLPHLFTTAHHVGSPPTSFRNPWPSYHSAGIVSALRTRFSTPKNYVPVPADRRGLVHVRKPDFAAQPAGFKATWIGHATFLVETTATPGSSRGFRILLDPVWSDRVGPYGLVGPVRVRRVHHRVSMGMVLTCLVHPGPLLPGRAARDRCHLHKSRSL